MRRRTRPTTLPYRLGFTLIELLVVIVILALLIGLLVPAVMQAVGKAKDASCAAEINTMTQALADFKSKFGCYPPSRIIVSENGDYNAATLGAGAALGQRTLTYLRRIWPRMQFNTSGTAGFATGLTNAAGGWYDVNGNGSVDAPYVLEGHQCLVLFLGGVPESSGAGWSMAGFSKSPSNPFQSVAVTTNRTVPLFEFNNGRLFGTGFPGYIDSFGASTSEGITPYYVYFSSYEGVGYDPDDCNGAEASSDGMIPSTLGGFAASNMPASTPLSTTDSPRVYASAAPNPYTSDPPIPNGAGAGAYVANSRKMPAWINAQSFQIISSGRDRLFGIGGQYLPNATNRLPFETTVPTANTLQSMAANAAVTSQTLGPDTRTREKDNVTNFSGGNLD